MKTNESNTVKGTVIKFAVSLSLPGGITMDDADFSVSFYIYTNRASRFGKKEMTRVDENTYTVEVDTEQIGSGLIKYQAEVILPDGRKEIVAGQTMELTVNGLH